MITASIPFWNGGGASVYETELNEWNTFKLDDEAFPSADAPALVTSVEAPVSYNVDKRKRKNKNGNRKVVQGYKATPITITFLIWTEDQYEAYRARLASIHPKYNADNRKPHRIYYPDLDDLDISEIYIDKIGTPTWTSEPGVRQIVIGGEEVYEDEKPATAKVKAPNKVDPNVGGVEVDPDFKSDDGPPK